MSAHPELAIAAVAAGVAAMIISVVRPFTTLRATAKSIRALATRNVRKIILRVEGKPYEIAIDDISGCPKAVLEAKKAVAEVERKARERATQELSRLETV